MTKFNEIQVGTRFEFDGVAYVKISALTANRIDNGVQRMIPRCAALLLCDGTAPLSADKAENSRTVPLARVHEALRDLTERALMLVEEEFGPGAAEGLRGRLEAASRRVLKDI